MTKVYINAVAQPHGTVVSWSIRRGDLADIKSAEACASHPLLFPTSEQPFTMMTRLLMLASAVFSGKQSMLVYHGMRSRWH